MSHAGIKRITLNYLTPRSTDFLIVGVIIAKRWPKRFKSKKDGSDRGVMGFTLRDSPADYINVTVWGSNVYVDNFNASYRVGDIVDLINTRVIMRKAEDKADIFQPPVTSCMELVFNEHQSEICPHDLEDCLDYIKILHLPTKPPGNFLNLTDIKANGKLFDGQFVNILVAVQRVGSRRDLKNRVGKDLSILEVVVLDKTSSDFMVQTWEEDVIQRGCNWKPRDTDVRVEWSEFRKAMMATITSRSIVTENPSTREAAILASFALSVPIKTPQLVDSLANTMIEVKNIVIGCIFIVVGECFRCNSVNTLKIMLPHRKRSLRATKLQQTMKVSKESSTCGCPSEGSICPRSDCCGGEPTLAYDLRINLIDHTGRLSNCRLTGITAKQIISVENMTFSSSHLNSVIHPRTALNYNLLETGKYCNVFPSITPEVFANLNPCDKTQLKWRWLLKKVSARLLILPVGPGRLSPLISVVELRRISLAEYANKLPVA